MTNELGLKKSNGIVMVAAVSYITSDTYYLVTIKEWKSMSPPKATITRTMMFRAGMGRGWWKEKAEGEKDAEEE